MKPVAELIAVPGKSFPALVFADGFRDLPAGTKLYAVKEQDAIDAQRYRYLRTGEGEIFAVYGSNGTWGECGHMNIYDDQLDTEIDKAIAARDTKEK